MVEPPPSNIDNIAYIVLLEATLSLPATVEALLIELGLRVEQYLRANNRARRAKVSRKWTRGIPITVELEVLRRTHVLPSRAATQAPASPRAGAFLRQRKFGATSRKAGGHNSVGKVEEVFMRVL